MIYLMKWPNTAVVEDAKRADYYLARGYVVTDYAGYRAARQTQDTLALERLRLGAVNSKK